MKINEILIESQQLDEGPLDAIGRGAGKLAGGIAKSVGSVAGGVAGLGSAFMKGYRGGKATVSGDDEEEPATSGKDAAGGATDTAGGGTSGGGASGGTSGGGASGGNAPAKTKNKPQSTFGRLNKAAGGEEEPAPADNTSPKSVDNAQPKPTDDASADTTQPKQADDAAGGTAYAQAQKAVQSLPPEQRKEIVTMLQSDPKVKAAMEKPATAKPVAGKPSAGAGAFGAMAKQLSGETPAAKPAAPDATKSSTGGTIEKTPGGVKHTANPNNPNAAKPEAPATTAAPAAEPADEKPGFLKTATDKIKDKAKKPAKPSQAEIDADREAKMGPTSDSIIRKGLMVSESFSFFRRR